MVLALQARQPELGIDERDVRCLELAGLLHDLGHGPWSHVWDGSFIPQAIPGSKWTHEDASEMMFDYILDDPENGMLALPADEVQFIKDLIQGYPRHASTKLEKPYLFQIVANKASGLDVDKLDYIARDSLNVGIKATYDIDRLLALCRVNGSDITYSIKAANDIYELFHSRWSLHRRVYSHRV